jgi:hypothetical protein
MDPLSRLVEALLLANYDTAARAGDEVRVRAHGRNFSILHSAEQFHVTLLDADTITRTCEDEDAVVEELRNW